jgi:hypothetical protein
MITFFLTLVLQANADTAVIRKIAVANGYAPSKKVMNAISTAAKAYNVPVAKMTAIAIVETGLGRFTVKRINKNGTYDQGLFQINDVNRDFCAEFNIYIDEGSAFCAAKLLNKLRKSRPHDYYAAYHSKTPSHKEIYKNKIDKVLQLSKSKLTKGDK